MEKEIQHLHELIKEMFPEAVTVNVFVNCEGIKVEPQYRTNIEGHSMKTITGKWVKQAKK